jgi:hypothetical protein
MKMNNEHWIVLLGKGGEVEQVWGQGGMDLQKALRLAANHVLYNPKKAWVHRVVIFSKRGARVFTRRSLEKLVP